MRAIEIYRDDDVKRMSRTHLVQSNLESQYGLVVGLPIETKEKQHIINLRAMKLKNHRKKESTIIFELKSIKKHTPKKKS